MAKSIEDNILLTRKTSRDNDDEMIAKLKTLITKREA
jgi:hypothetical protein